MRTKLSAVALIALACHSARANVRVVDQDWIDATRSRTVPVRIYIDDAHSTRPSPLILLSHGLGGSRKAMGFAAEAWAARGYVCVTLQHAGSDESLWRDAPLGQRLDAVKTGMTAEAYKDRCLDVRFAIDQLTQLNARDGMMENRLDLSRIGIAGHSFGAQTVQAVIGQKLGVPRLEMPTGADPRVKAAVAFSPAFNYGDRLADWAFAGVTTPCLHFTGTKDIAPVGGATVQDRRVPFDHVPAGEQYLITIDGGDHAVFGGGEGRLRERPEYAAWHKLIVDVTTKFWDAELRDDADARRWMHEEAKSAVGKLGAFEAKLAPTSRPTSR